jgi:hypothetical protein
MLMSRLTRTLLTCGIALAAQSASAQETTGSIGESTFLQGLRGSFSGSGMLMRSSETSPRSLTCSFTGNPQGTQVTLNGRCSAGILSTSVNVAVRFDPASRRYIGSYRDGIGTIATLSGSRRGNNLVLAFNETAQSTNPGPPGRMTIGQTGGQLGLSLRSSQPGAGQNLNLTMQKQ